MKPLPSRMKIAELFVYRNGNLFNRVSRGGGAIAGALAGHDDSEGYRTVKIGSSDYKVHRLIYKLIHGYDPDQIDHINGDKGDNRIGNLRSVSNAENARNRKMSSNNTSGRAGVGWHKKQKRWQARIRVSGQLIHLGSYIEFDDAVRAREEAEVLYGFANVRAL